ncbi:unnamed protein product [Gongylonema pulchrum]|uniref:Transmembrane protein n=1 Tax=Gongylonema pulchrum TaxID=637853 RepID=A0A183ERQ2_9BILA|nr:unnamed protein product [Gongylonema pulchrum]
MVHDARARAPCIVKLCPEQLIAKMSGCPGPVETAVGIVHGIGATFAFIFGVLYLWGQVILVALTKPHLGGFYFNLIRIILVIIATIAVVTYETLVWQHPRASLNDTRTDGHRSTGIVWVDPDSPVNKYHL